MKNVLKKDINSIQVRFDSTIPYIRKRQTEHPIPLRSGPHTISGGNRVRKEQCNYGWDWGPCLLTCGIWRPISIIGYDTARLGEVSIRQKHRKSREVNLDIQADLADAATGKSVTAEFIISRGTKSMTSGKAGKLPGAGLIYPTAASIGFIITKAITHINLLYPVAVHRIC